jgi:hypothetical protein
MRRLGVEGPLRISGRLGHSGRLRVARRLRVVRRVRATGQLRPTGRLRPTRRLRVTWSLRTAGRFGIRGRPQVVRLFRMDRIHGSRQLRIHGSRRLRIHGSRRLRIHWPRDIRMVRRVRPRHIRFNGRLRGRRPGNLGLVRLWKVRPLRLRVQRIRNLRGVGGRISSGIVYRTVEYVVQLVPLSRIEYRGRVRIHDAPENKFLAAGRAD